MLGPAPNQQLQACRHLSLWNRRSPEAIDPARSIDLLEEVVITASLSPAGAASVDDDEEMANVASNREELEDSFMIKGCSGK